jgi:hypothetical protein
MIGKIHFKKVSQRPQLSFIDDVIKKENSSLSNFITKFELITLENFVGFGARNLQKFIRSLWGQCYKKNFVRDLRIFALSQSVS